MGQDDNLNISLAHIVLGFVAGRGLSRVSSRSYTHPGMHANFFIHSVFGFLRYQSSIFNNDFAQIYAISYKATRYLALPCLNADLYSQDKNLSAIHLVSGLIPFVLVLAGSDNPSLGNLVIACNIISLCHHSMQHNNEWGWYTAAGGVLAYFISHNMEHRIIYPLALAGMEYCAYKMYHRVFDAPPPLPQGRR